MAVAGSMLDFFHINTLRSTQIGGTRILGGGSPSVGGALQILGKISLRLQHLTDQRSDLHRPAK